MESITKEALQTTFRNGIVEALIWHLAYHDPLTGLPNRLLLQRRISELLLQARRRREMVALLFLDLDGLKAINDGMGHAAGDALLLEIAHRLSESIGPDDAVARLGGDEFVILLGGLPLNRDVSTPAEAILNEIRTPLEIDGNQVKVTASIGISLYPLHSSDPESLLKQADTAMYRVKARGGDDYQLYWHNENLSGDDLVICRSARNSSKRRTSFSLR